MNRGETIEENKEEKNNEVCARLDMVQIWAPNHGTQFSIVFIAMWHEKLVEHWMSSISHAEGNG